MSADVQGLESTFLGWTEAFGAGDLAKAYGAMDADMVIFDEDIPWRFSKKDFEEHIQFHVPLWESFAWVPRDLQYVVKGTTGVVSGYSTFRGKPKDAGFRQRFMAFTQTWAYENGAWTMLIFHQTPLHGQIEGASPS